MNDNFVNIKVDREERPDLDHIYMDAVQAITGSGGWPLNVFLPPRQNLFTAAPIFRRAPSPTGLPGKTCWRGSAAPSASEGKRSHNRPKASPTILPPPVPLVSALRPPLPLPEPPVNPPPRRPDPRILRRYHPRPIFNPDTLRQIRDQLLATADRRDGGFGHAPKFPQTFSIRWLLHYYHFTKDQPSLDQACLSLDKMIRGGIYDHLGGGLARYSTDNEWLAPHFEKMLYDNALLIIALSDAYRLTPTDEYQATIEGIMQFIDRELSNGDGGFYAALDADSEGIEGKYYVWDQEEIESVLKEDAVLFCRFYGVTAQGNWEGKNILTRPGAADRTASSRRQQTTPRPRPTRPKNGHPISSGSSKPPVSASSPTAPPVFVPLLTIRSCSVGTPS